MVSPGWWGFRGTGFGRGERVPGLVGPEADRVYPDRTLPRPLQILAHTPYSCRGTMTSAQSVYYSTPSGAGVFTAGTLRWGCALVDRCDRPLGPVTQRFVRIVTGNLVTGLRHGSDGCRRAGSRQRHGLRPAGGQLRVRELRHVRRPSAIMGPMVVDQGRVRVVLVALVVALAPALAACSDPEPDQPPPAEESVALRVETVRGAGKLPEQDRTEIETAVGDVLSQYVVGAFLGDFPREEFVASFESFTSGVAGSAAEDIDLLTAATGQGRRVRARDQARRAPVVPGVRRRRRRGDGGGRLRLRGDDGRGGDPEPLPGRPVHAPGEGRHLVDLRVRRRARRRRARSARRSRRDRGPRPAPPGQVGGPRRRWSPSSSRPRRSGRPRSP